jgi:anti-sigma factor RsiW
MRRDRLANSDAERALDAAYVDGAAELSTDDRRRIEARLADDPEARAEHAAVRGLLARLRALPPEGAEPDWMMLERSIRAAVGPDVPRPWWRRWTSIAPLTAAVTAALVLLVIWGRPATRTSTALEATRHGSAQIEPPVRQAPAPATGDDPVALWLDGAVVHVDPTAADALITPGGDEAADEVGLLPSTDLAWVDNLDDAALDRAERWLAGKKG